MAPHRRENEERNHIEKEHGCERHRDLMTLGADGRGDRGDRAASAYRSPDRYQQRGIALGVAQPAHRQTDDS